MQDNGNHRSASRDRPGFNSGLNGVDELKTVTLLTIDIRGFSRMAKQMGPERTLRLLNRFFAATGEIVFRRHGLVDKYLGDGFLAVFGIPESSGQDADNAVRAALDIQRGLAELNTDLWPDFGTILHMGMSLHTGEVVAGHVGFERKKDYTVIGDAVNMVFRMQSLVKAFPNGILVSGTTLAMLRSRCWIRAVDLPSQTPHDLSGLALYELLEPEAYGAGQVTAPSRETTQRDTSSNLRRRPSPNQPPPILSP
jgi:class 3 adenylate cyclase